MTGAANGGRSGSALPSRVSTCADRAGGAGHHDRVEAVPREAVPCEAVRLRGGPLRGGPS